MNVPAMIKKLGGKNYPVTRVNADGSYSESDGTFQPGATTILPVLGVYQPLSEDELVSIPEGDRTRERFRFYSAAPIQNQDTARLRKSDRISIVGVLYEVEGVFHWPNHSKSIIARVNADDN